MPRIRKTAVDRKTEIVQTAIRLAAELGPDRVTARHLAEAIGISQPAIFRHFTTMSDIWRAVAETIATRLSEAKTDSGAADPLDALMELVVWQLDFIRRTPAVPAILFSRELHVENEEMRRHFEAVMADRRRGIAEFAERAKADGLFAPDVVAADFAALVLATIQGLAMRWSLENRKFDLPDEGQRLIRTLIDGFRAR